MGAGLATFGEAAGGTAEVGVIPAALNSPGENMLLSRVCWAENKHFFPAKLKQVEHNV